MLPVANFTKVREEEEGEIAAKSREEGEIGHKSRDCRPGLQRSICDGVEGLCMLLKQAGRFPASSLVVINALKSRLYNPLIFRVSYVPWGRASGLMLIAVGGGPVPTPKV